MAACGVTKINPAWSHVVSPPSFTECLSFSSFFISVHASFFWSLFRYPKLGTFLPPYSVHQLKLRYLEALC